MLGKTEEWDFPSIELLNSTALLGPLLNIRTCIDKKYSLHSPLLSADYSSGFLYVAFSE